MRQIGGQIFAWTGPTPVGVGLANFIMVFDLGGITRIAIRSNYQETYVDLPRTEALRLAQELVCALES